APVVSHNGNLGAHTRIASRSLELEQTLLDFRHFVFKELADEIRRGTRQDHLLATCGAVDLQDIGAHPIANPQVFARDHFGTGQPGFDLADLHYDIALVKTLDRAGHDRLATLEEVVEQLLELRVAAAVQDD